MRILITAGGTEEPIDGVRYISNFSSGSTGAKLADILYKNNFEVTLLTSRLGISPKSNVRLLRYTSFSNLKQTLFDELDNNSYDAVIHAAAVSDYSVDYIESGNEKLLPDSEIKLDSSKPLKIVLKSNIKLVNNLKSYSKKPIKVIAFKLTKNASESLIKDKVNKILSSGVVDFVVHNDLTSITKSKHITRIYDTNRVILKGSTKEDLGKNIIELLTKEI